MSERADKELDATKQREKEFIERQFRCKRMRDNADKNNHVLCRRCGFTGLIAAKWGKFTPAIKPGVDQRRVYSFRCPFCVASEQMGIHESYPVWDHELAKEFEII